MGNGGTGVKMGSRKGWVWSRQVHRLGPVYRQSLTGEFPTSLLQTVLKCLVFWDEGQWANVDSVGLPDYVLVLTRSLPNQRTGRRTTVQGPTTVYSMTNQTEEGLEERNMNPKRRSEVRGFDTETRESYTVPLNVLNLIKRYDDSVSRQ